MGLMDAEQLGEIVDQFFVTTPPSADTGKTNSAATNPAADPAAANEAQHLRAWAEVVAPAIAKGVETPPDPPSSIATKVTPAQQSVKQSNAKGKRWTEEEKEVLLELHAQAKERRMSDSERRRFITNEFAVRGIDHTYNAAKQALLRLQKAPSVCKPRGGQTKPMKVSKCSACGAPRRGHICKKKQAQQQPLAPRIPRVMAMAVLPGDEQDRPTGEVTA